MKRIFFLLLLIAQVGLSQSLVATIPLTVDKFIGFDSYKNLYTTEGMVLYKTGPLGKFEFTDFTLGNITSVDIINPLNVVLYYQQSNTVVLLDNRLTEIERINFNTLPPFINSSKVSNAGGNRLWVFDQDLQQLSLLNYRNNTTSELSQPISETIIQQTSNFNYCYLLTDKNIIGFTLFGGILYNIPFLNAEKIIQFNEELIILKNNELYKIAENTKEINPYFNPEITIKDLQLTRDFLYIYDGKNLHTFSINQPKK